ncbi:gap junction gamma-1 protein-like [Scomber scombrus]|uniref:Gap junction gamma-1 protein-like n=1 Tax=Scomber scombrus TaxID=13677 RepID=A0AAV1NAY8_SCOSC
MSYVNERCQFSLHNEQAESGGGSGVSRRKPKKHYLKGRKHNRGIEEPEDDQEKDPMIYEMAKVESDRSGAAKGDRGDGQAAVKFSDDELYGLTKGPGALNETGLSGEDYSSYPFSWNAPSAPPGYNIAIKSLLVSKGSHDHPLPITDLTNAKMACRQNHVNIAQEERQQYTNNEDNLCRAGMGDAPGGSHRDIRQPQNRLEADNQAHSQQQSHSNNHSRPNRDRKHRHASKHTLSKADPDRGNSSTGSSCKYGEIKGSEWI